MQCYQPVQAEGTEWVAQEPLPANLDSARCSARKCSVKECNGVCCRGLSATMSEAEFSCFPSTCTLGAELQREERLIFLNSLWWFLIRKSMSLVLQQGKSGTGKANLTQAALARARLRLWQGVAVEVWMASRPRPSFSSIVLGRAYETVLQSCRSCWTCLTQKR